MDPPDLGNNHIRINPSSQSSQFLIRVPWYGRISRMVDGYLDSDKEMFTRMTMPSAWPYLGKALDWY